MINKVFSILSFGFDVLISEEPVEVYLLKFSWRLLAGHSKVRAYLKVLRLPSETASMLRLFSGLSWEAGRKLD